MSRSLSTHLFSDSSQTSNDLLTVTAIRGSCSIASLPSGNRPRDAHLQEITPYARELSTFHARTFIKIPATLEGPRRSANSNDLCKRKLREFALQIDFASSLSDQAPVLVWGFNLLWWTPRTRCRAVFRANPTAELWWAADGEGTSFWREANKSYEWKYFFSGGNINNRMTAHSLIYVLDLLQ